MELDTQKITISTEALSQEVNGETVILDLKGESYFGLDEVGTRIWQLLQENSSLQNIHETLLQEYEVDSEQLEKDIKLLLDELLNVGLVSLEKQA
ncbi:MAG: PqqD family protein [Nitrosomonadaceae bacterium]